MDTNESNESNFRSSVYNQDDSNSSTSSNGNLLSNKVSNRSSNTSSNKPINLVNKIKNQIANSDNELSKSNKSVFSSKTPKSNKKWNSRPTSFDKSASTSSRNLNTKTRPANQFKPNKKSNEGKGQQPLNDFEIHQIYNRNINLNQDQPTRLTNNKAFDNNRVVRSE